LSQFTRPPAKVFGEIAQSQSSEARRRLLGEDPCHWLQKYSG
jgi:hypothetical protein